MTIGARVPGWQKYLDRWAQASAALHASRRIMRDLRYGPRPRQRLDLILAAERDIPVLSFLHGGYWQWNDKEGQACAGTDALGRGFNVSIVQYTLCPTVGMGEIVDEVWASLDWLAQHGFEYGVDGTGVIAIGISAGAHLAATQLAQPSVKAALLISGIYNLEPIRHTWLNRAVGLNAETARQHSPLFHLPKQAGPVVFAVGGDELPELRRQTGEYAEAWIAMGLCGCKIEVAGANHFSILEQLLGERGMLSEALGHLAREAGVA
jgi:arylformamidase